MKKKSLLILVAMTLLILPCSVNAAGIVFDDSNGTYDDVGRIFTFDILLGDIGALSDFDGFNFEFDITRQGSNATFSLAFDPTVKNDIATYALNSSFDYGVIITPPNPAISDTYNVFAGDANTLAEAGSYTPGGVLVRLMLDDVDMGDIFDVALTGSNSFYLSSVPDVEFIDPLNYEVTVVPIPAAAWLLGAGLLGLVGLRRKSN